MTNQPSQTVETAPVAAVPGSVESTPKQSSKFKKTVGALAALALAGGLGFGGAKLGQELLDSERGASPDPAVAPAEPAPTAPSPTASYDDQSDNLVEQEANPTNSNCVVSLTENLADSTKYDASIMVFVCDADGNEIYINADSIINDVNSNHQSPEAVIVDDDEAPVEPTTTQPPPVEQIEPTQVEDQPEPEEVEEQVEEVEQEVEELEDQPEPEEVEEVEQEVEEAPAEPEPPTIDITNPDPRPARHKTVSADSDDEVTSWLAERVEQGTDCDAKTLKYGATEFDSQPKITLNDEKHNGDSVCFGAEGKDDKWAYKLSAPVDAIDRTAPDVDLTYDSEGGRVPDYKTVTAEASDNFGVDYASWRAAMISRNGSCNDAVLDRRGASYHTETPTVYFVDGDEGKRVCVEVTDLAGNVERVRSRVINGPIGEDSDQTWKGSEDAAGDSVISDPQPDPEEVVCTDTKTGKETDCPF